MIFGKLPKTPATNTNTISIR